MRNKTFNTIAEFIAYVSQLNYVSIDGDKFIADNGAILSLNYKLMVDHGISGVQLSLHLFATSDGGMVAFWGATNSIDNVAIAKWWLGMTSTLYRIEDEIKENAVKALREKLG